MMKYTAFEFPKSLLLPTDILDIIFDFSPSSRYLINKAISSVYFSLKYKKIFVMGDFIEAVDKFSLILTSPTIYPYYQYICELYLMICWVPSLKTIKVELPNLSKLNLEFDYPPCCRCFELHVVVINQLLDKVKNSSKFKSFGFANSDLPCSTSERLRSLEHLTELDVVTIPEDFFRYNSYKSIHSLTLQDILTLNPLPFVKSLIITCSIVVPLNLGLIFPNLLKLTYDFDSFAIHPPIYDFIQFLPFAIRELDLELEYYYNNDFWYPILSGLPGLCKCRFHSISTDVDPQFILNYTLKEIKQISLLIKSCKFKCIFDNSSSVFISNYYYRDEFESTIGSTIIDELYFNTIYIIYTDAKMLGYCKYASVELVVHQLP